MPRMPRRIRRFLPVGLVASLLLLASACAADAPQDTLEPQGPISRQIDRLSDPVFLVAGVVFIIVAVFFVVRPSGLFKVESAERV